ncbi:hypothetical protein [Natronococcus wangiae]|uniref:hypothetical protein n=1 Tax=Natronococcus wangiae TaxID=3068275 RepID=UPI00273EBE91|nr:hypothetical protein [Natronococcus sp. AD5]
MDELAALVRGSPAFPGVRGRVEHDALGAEFRGEIHSRDEFVDGALPDGREGRAGIDAKRQVNDDVDPRLEQRLSFRFGS